MPNLIAFDTATDACSVALYTSTTVTQHYAEARRNHGAYLLPWLDALLTTASLTLQDIDVLAFAHGPGSFTGVRLAASVVQSLAFVANIPVVGVSTLQALAQQAWRLHGHTHVAVALDTHADTICWGCFTLSEQSIMCAQGAVCTVAPHVARAPEHPERYVRVGVGWARYAAQLASEFNNMSASASGHYSQAHDIAVLAQAAWQQGAGEKPEAALPRYHNSKAAWL